MFKSPFDESPTRRGAVGVVAKNGFLFLCGKCADSRSSGKDQHSRQNSRGDIFPDHPAPGSLKGSLQFEDDLFHFQVGPHPEGPADAERAKEGKARKNKKKNDGNSFYYLFHKNTLMDLQIHSLSV